MGVLKRYIVILTLIISLHNVAAAISLIGISASDRKDTTQYTLFINESKIRSFKDTMFGRAKILISHYPLMLTNNSNDTLRYMTMSASWWDIYVVDNQNFGLATDYWNVFKNGIIVRVLPPHKNITTDISIITDVKQRFYNKGQKFRIGMSIQQPDASLSPKLWMLKPKITTNLLWSNEVTIK